MATQGERITAVEVEQRAMRETLEAHNKLLESQNQKLDELLALRNKGAGVFWLFSALVGSGMIGLALQMIQWIKGY